MLILTRKRSQSILIGDGIKITIIDVQGNQVRIGIEAPKDLTILREELISEVQEENLKALQVDPNALNKLGEVFIHKNAIPDGEK